MGYLRRHAILVTASYSITGKGDPEVPQGWHGKHWIEYAHYSIEELCVVCPVTEIVESAMNGDKHFMVAPDGSKEGWHDSEVGDNERSQVIEWLRSVAYSDGSSPLNWVEVQYGDDNDEARVVASGDDDQARRNRQLYPEVPA